MKQTKRNDRNATHLICTKCKCIKLVKYFFIRSNGSRTSHCNICRNEYEKSKRPRKKPNKLGVPGVTYLPKKKIYRARIEIYGKQYYLGISKSLEKAAELYRLQKETLMASE